MKRMILWVGAATVLMFGMFYLAWNGWQSAEKNETDESEWVVGLSIHFLQDDYTVNVVDSFEQVMKDNNVKTVVLSANGDAKKQMADIEDMITQEVDAIGICPFADSAVRQSLNRAIEQGIKVVTITEISGVEADAVIYGNEYENGYGCGRRLAKALQDVDNAEVAVLDFPFDVDRGKERIEGFEDALEGTGIKITAQGRPSSNEEAMDYVKELLADNPNIRGIFGSYSNQVIGAGAACKALGRSDVVVVGVDADMVVLKMIQEGWVLAVTAQFPAEHGEYCAKAILEQLEGLPGLTSYPTAYQIVDSTNAAQMAQRLWGREL